MSEPPKRFLRFLAKHKYVGEVYQALGEATTQGGPPGPKEVALVKVGIAAGMRHEGAVHAHARQASAAGCTPEEIRHAVVPATTTLGFPSMMAAYGWVDDVLKSERARQ